MGQTKVVRNAINRTFSSQGGVFWEGIKDSQLNEYWLKVLDEYLKQPIQNQNRKKAALTLGRNGQEGKEVYILSEKVQVWQEYRIALKLIFNYSALLFLSLFCAQMFSL